MCPDNFSGKTPRGSFPVSDFLPLVVAFWVVGYGSSTLLLVFKGQIFENK